MRKNGMMFSRELSKFVEPPECVLNFLKEIEAVYKKYDMSIAHEDTGGSFIIDDYREENIEWLEGASINF